MGQGYTTAASMVPDGVPALLRHRSGVGKVRMLEGGVAGDRIRDGGHA